MILFGSLIFIPLSYLTFHQLLNDSNTMPWVFAINLAILGALVNSCYALAIAEQFPTALRYSGFGLCFNLGFALIGGFSPLIYTYLISASNDPFSVYYYLATCALVTAIGSLCRMKPLAQNTESAQYKEADLV
jgi:MHS family proline/betaine transporter-like MFS transporter